jgi:hypothetical protein
MEVREVEATEVVEKVCNRGRRTRDRRRGRREVGAIHGVGVHHARVGVLRNDAHAGIVARRQGLAGSVRGCKDSAFALFLHMHLVGRRSWDNDLLGRSVN